MKEYSVCMSVYKNDRPEWFVTAVHSIWRQTITPKEIILVVDGFISEDLKETIAMLQREVNCMNVIYLPQNLGHAAARQVGLEAACCDLVAIMDSDDIALPNRFEKQLEYLECHPDISVVGGFISEFVDAVDNAVSRRIVPQNDVDIKKYLKSRCPMNLVTIMARKSDIIAVGGYQEWFCEEDYYLWIRLTLAGCKFYNIPEVLVNVRVGKDMYNRRGGWQYFKSESSLQRYMYCNNIISFPRYLYNVCGRFIIQVAMSNRMRSFVYKKIFRE